VRIRTQSYLLIGGIAVMPFLVIVIALTFQRLYAASRNIPRYDEVRDALREAVAERDPALFDRAVSKRPPGLEVAVADRDGTVVFSTFADIPVGAAAGPALWRAAARADPDLVYQVGMPEGMPDGYLAFSRVTRDFVSPERLLSHVFVLALAALAAILVFAAAMSIMMVRSIARSVLELNDATTRVAEGELDVPIRVEGSNEITSLAESLDRMRGEIKEDRARRARFVMGVSHDLKTPLALIQGYAEALEDAVTGEDRSAERDRYLAIIQEKAARLADMIDELIDFVRVDTGEWRRAQKPVRLAAFLRGFVRRVEADARLLDRRAAGHIDLPETVEVPMDERLATRALENLVNNSLRYTAPGGCVTVRARAKADRCLLEVSDDGPGIAAADVSHVFDPFFRGSSSRREEGLGLGLSVVKSIIESHGWEITLVSPAGHGCTFTITLPIGTPGCAGAV
jgi:signal transduction histidine kinase